MADSKPYEFVDKRFQAIREKVHYHPGRDDFPEVLCEECRAIIEPSAAAYTVEGGHIYCTFCIEEWTPMEEEGRVPEADRIRPEDIPGHPHWRGGK